MVHCGCRTAPDQGGDSIAGHQLGDARMRPCDEAGELASQDGTVAECIEVECEPYAVLGHCDV